jgi:hypothetical protein
MTWMSEVLQVIIMSRVGYVTRQITSRSLRIQRVFIELIHPHLLRVRNTPIKRAG